jgi:hypothetical protein
LTKDDRLAALASLRVESVGVPLLRRVKTHLKPTSAALQLYGKYSTDNIVKLEFVQLAELVEKKELNGEFPVSPGYVVISTKGVFIGCALYLPGRLVSQFPRHLFTSKTWNYLLADKTDWGI